MVEAEEVVEKSGSAGTVCAQRISNGSSLPSFCVAPSQNHKGHMLFPGNGIVEAIIYLI